MVAVAVAVGVVDGLVDSEQPTSANMIVTTRSGMTRRIVRTLATADRSTVASTRLLLNVFTSRPLRKIVCGPGLVGLQRKCLVSDHVTSCWSAAGSVARAGVVSASDELLTTVDVGGGAGQRRVDHQVDGKRGDIFCAGLPVRLAMSSSVRCGGPRVDYRAGKPRAGCR